MNVKVFALGPFATNTLVLIPDRGDKVFLVDPGFDVEQVLVWLKAQGKNLEAVLLTHAHLDHAYGVAAVHDAFPDAPVLLHPEDFPLYENLAEQARLFGFPPPQMAAAKATLADGLTLQLEGETLLVRHCPGHSPGHVIFQGNHGDKPWAAVGDVIFAGSVGRTDLWGGSFAALEHSIRRVIYALPPETTLFPGHGPATTVAREMATNPFVSQP